MAFRIILRKLRDISAEEAAALVVVGVCGLAVLVDFIRWLSSP